MHARQVACNGNVSLARFEQAKSFDWFRVLSIDVTPDIEREFNLLQRYGCGSLTP